MAIHNLGIMKGQFLKQIESDKQYIVFIHFGWFNFIDELLQDYH